MLMAKLCLGTVQFGMKYGINNKHGQPSRADSFEMLDLALSKGIHIFDTAQAYGEAEELLGEYIESRKVKNEVRVISKLRPNIFQDHSRDILHTMEDEIYKSIKKLNIDKLQGFLLHTPEYVYNPKIVESLIRCKEKGLVEHVGISVYNVEEGIEAINTGVMDYIQLPYSVLDQRFMKDDFMKKAKSSGITVFARSALLQGLYTMKKEEIPSYLSKAIIHIEEIEKIVNKYEVDKISALLHFVCDNEWIDYLVFGVDTKEQLQIDIDYITRGRIPKDLIEEIKMKFQNIDNSIILPSLWAVK